MLHSRKCDLDSETFALKCSVVPGPTEADKGISKLETHLSFSGSLCAITDEPPTPSYAIGEVDI